MSSFASIITKNILFFIHSRILIQMCFEYLNRKQTYTKMKLSEKKLNLFEQT